MGEERCIQGFGGEDVREGVQLGDLSVDGRMILKCIYENLGGKA
jgi:hypothetical protein